MIKMFVRGQREVWRSFFFEQTDQFLASLFVQRFALHEEGYQAVDRVPEVGIGEVLEGLPEVVISLQFGGIEPRVSDLAKVEYLLAHEYAQHGGNGTVSGAFSALFFEHLEYISGAAFAHFPDDLHDFFFGFSEQFFLHNLAIFGGLRAPF